MKLEEFSIELRRYASLMNIQIDEKKAEEFYKYMNLLLEWNEKINLTAITDPKEIIIKHFVDSIIPATNIKDESKIIDVGTGAGFPGIPLKIYNDSYKLTLLDSLNKRAIFLREVVSDLGLTNVEIIHGRAEDYAQNIKYRAKFDYAVSRAVAPMNILLEYLVPYTKVNGKIIAMKGSNAEEEIINSKNALLKLDTTIEEKQIISLPDNCGERYIIIMKKSKETNKIYPRKAGTPKKNPL